MRVIDWLDLINSGGVIHHRLLVNTEAHVHTQSHAHTVAFCTGVFALEDSLQMMESWSQTIKM